MRLFNPETLEVATLDKLRERSASPELLPEDAKTLGWTQLTETAVPTFNPLSQVVVEDGPILMNGEWRAVWRVRDLSEAEVNDVIERIASEFDRALTAHFDKTAQSQRYDNRITCTMRAGYSGPFQAQGFAFAQWMDECNLFAHQMQLGVMAGKRPLPGSIEAFIAELPPMVWPA